MIDRARQPPTDRELLIELGRARMPRHEAQALQPGSIVTLETLVDEPVDILVDGRVVAQGEVLELDGQFCIRVTRLVAGDDAQDTGRDS